MKRKNTKSNPYFFSNIKNDTYWHFFFQKTIFGKCKSSQHAQSILTIQQPRVSFLLFGQI